MLWCRRKASPTEALRITKGMRLTSTPRIDDEALRRAYPEFEDVFKEAGPSYGPAYERETAAIREIARRLELVREQLKKVRGK